MKYVKYLFRWVMYLLGKLMVTSVCIPSKLGLGHNFCNIMRASRDLGAGSGAYHRKEFDECFRILKPYLDREDDHCHGGITFILAHLYFYGKGVQMDRDVSKYLFEKSAALGWVEATNYLSNLNNSEENEHNKSN